MPRRTAVTSRIARPQCSPFRFGHDTCWSGQPAWGAGESLAPAGLRPYRCGAAVPRLDRAGAGCMEVLDAFDRGRRDRAGQLVPGGRGALKARADDLDFSNWDRTCYDAIYDLAGVDPGLPDDTFVAALRAAVPTDPERFLLYQLVHLQVPTPAGREPQGVLVRRCALPCRDSIPLLGPSGGPLCALEIDGVLESTAYGFSMITPTAMIAIRALANHGFRPVPVTGRSLAEVRERCSILDLAGGVAEYGAVVYDHGRDSIEQVVSDADMVLLDRLREFCAVPLERGLTRTSAIASGPTAPVRVGERSVRRSWKMPSRRWAMTAIGCG